MGQIKGQNFLQYAECVPASPSMIFITNKSINIALVN